MITPITPIVPPVITYDGIWLRNIQISAPNPSQPVRAMISISPFCSASGSLSPVTKQIMIPDVYAAAASSSYVSAVMSNIFAYVQDRINSGSVTF